MKVRMTGTRARARLGDTPPWYGPSRAAGGDHRIEDLTLRTIRYVFIFVLFLVCYANTTVLHALWMPPLGGGGRDFCCRCCLQRLWRLLPLRLLLRLLHRVLTLQPFVHLLAEPLQHCVPLQLVMPQGPR